MEKQDYRRKEEIKPYDTEITGSYVARIKGHTYIQSELRRRGKNIE